MNTNTDQLTETIFCRTQSTPPVGWN